MPSTGYAAAFNSFIVAIGNQGAFALGTLLGCVVSYAMHHLADKNNRIRLNIDLEREKELRVQLQTKDERINKLHDQVSTLHQTLADVRAGKKK
jgi:uncharacterized protein YlxW (UPF0749 family)